MIEVQGAKLYIAGAINHFNIYKMNFSQDKEI